MGGDRRGAGHDGGLFKSPLASSARARGVEIPVNPLSIVASMVVLVVNIQHSYKLSRLEERSRTHAEEVALLRLEIQVGNGGTRESPKVDASSADD